MHRQSRSPRRQAAAFANLLGALFSAGACSDAAGPRQHQDSGADYVEADGEAPEPEDDPHADAGEDGAGEGTDLDADTADSGSEPDGAPTACACSAPTPVCLSGSCVQCGAEDESACTALEVCDEASHVCVARAAPYALDCGHLPSGGACQGGPREVILGIHTSGLIAMFDPQDGHFLGWFSRRSIPQEVEETTLQDYYFATQGPDQCIWTVVNNSTATGKHAVDRLDTDGSFKDAIIQIGQHFLTDTSGASQEVVQRVHSIAFTQDSVYVASTRGSPAARVSRFSLDGKFEEVALDDGSEVESLLVMRDGSMVISNTTTGNVELLSPDASRRTIVVRPGTPGQVAWAGNGSILTIDSDYDGGGKAYLVNLSGVVEKSIMPNKGDRTYDDTTLYGIAPLRNGRWLLATDYFGVRSLDPDSGSPPGQHTDVLSSDPNTSVIKDFYHFGRACLPEAFVQSRDPAADLPLTNCAAPAGQALFAADFEDGMDGFEVFDEPWALEYSSTTVTRESAGPSGMALRVEGGVNDVFDWYEVPTGAYANLAGLPASFVEYSVRVADPALQQASVFALNEKETGEMLEIIRINEGRIGSREADDATAPMGQDWVRVQMRDFDWVNGTYDLYLSRPGADEICTRIGNDIVFSRFAMTGRDGVKQLQLFNGSASEISWFDNIVVK